MFLVKLEAENYKSFEHVEMDFNDRGLICILGSTDDPLSPSNGAGKSTVRSSLTWCWFGKNNAGQKADSVLSWFAPKNCYVKTTLCSGYKGTQLKDKVEITRYRNHDVFENQIHIHIDGKHSHYSDNDEAQSVIDAVLGFNYDLFSLLLTAGSNSRKMVSFVQMTDSERKEFMDYLLDLTYLNTAKNFVASDIKVATANIQTIDYKIDTAKALLSDYLLKYDDYISRKDRFSIDKAAQINNVEKSIVGVKHSIDILQGEITSLKGKIADVKVPALDEKVYTKQQEVIEKDIHDLTADTEVKRNTIFGVIGEMKRVETDISNLKKFKPVIEHTEEMTNLNTSMEGLRKSVIEEEQILKHIPKPEGLNKEQEKIRQLQYVSVKAKAIHELATKNGELGKLKLKLSKVKVDSTATMCDNCGQEISLDKLKAYTDGIEAEIKATKLAMTSLETDCKVLDDCEKAYKAKCEEDNENQYEQEYARQSVIITNLKKRLEQLGIALNKAVTKAEDARKLLDEKLILSSTKKDVELKEEYDIINDSIKANDAMIAKLRSKESSINDEYKAKMQAREKLLEEKNALTIKHNHLVAEVKNYNSTIERHNENIEAIKNEKNPYIELLDALSIDIAKNNEVTRDLGLKRTKYTEDLKYLNYWDKGFSNTGIKSFILDSIVNMLNSKANYCLDKLTNGEIKITFSTQKELKSKEMRENFNIKILKCNNTASFEDLSKGERCKTDMAVNYALQYLAETYHSAKLNFMFYDESLDGLDMIGCQQVIRFLREELSHFSSIFVVSHNDTLRQMFDQSLIVTKVNGRTNISF